MPIKLYDGKKRPYKNNSFDTISAIFTLHHCDDEISILKELIRVSHKQIILVEEIYDNLLEKYYLYTHDWIGNRLESWNVNIPFHFHKDTKWEKIFKSLNCNLVKSFPIKAYPPFLSCLLLTFTKSKVYILTKNR